MFSFIFGYQNYSFFYVVAGYSPFFLSQADVDLLGLPQHSLEKEIVPAEDGYHQSIIWENKAPYLPLIVQSYLSETQILKVHRGLGRAPTDEVMKVLKAADPKEETSKIRKALKKIAKKMENCALTQPSPRLFLFYSRYEGTGDLKSSIFVDFVKITDGAVLHMVCASVGF